MYAYGCTPTGVRLRVYAYGMYAYGMYAYGMYAYGCTPTGVRLRAATNRMPTLWGLFFGPNA